MQVILLPPPPPPQLLFTICDSVARYTAESEERFIPESVTHFPDKISISLVFFNPFPHPTPFLQQANSLYGLLGMMACSDSRGIDRPATFSALTLT